MITEKMTAVSTMVEIMPLIQESLNAGSAVRIFPMGSSMLPMIRQGTDSVVLSPVSGALKKYDLPLYRREKGKYVLHRIVEAADTYTCLGDNQFVPESGIRQDQIIAVVTAFYRGDKLYSVDNPAYRLYCRLWYHSRHCRRVVHRAGDWCRRHFR